MHRSNSTNSINSNESTDSKKRKREDNPSKTTTKRVTNSEILEILNSIKVDTACIPDIKQRIETLEIDVDELKKKNTDRGKDIDEINKRIDNIDNVEVNEQQAEDVLYCKSVIEVAIPEFNKHLLRSNHRASVIKDIIISGFPYIGSSIEELRKVVDSIFNVLEIKAEVKELDVQYLLKTSEIALQASQPGHVDEIRRIPFVVKLNDSSLVKKILSAKRKYKKMEFSKLDKNKFKTLKKYEKFTNFTIYINESLSKYHYNLLKSADQELKGGLKFKRVWQSNGYVYAQFRDDLIIHQINSNSDIEKLVNIYKPNP